MAAATSLAKIGYTDGRYVALEYIADPFDALRAQAVITLGYTGNARDLQILDAILTDDDSIAVQVSAASAILTLMDRVGAPSR
jgi:HEAT repeat protein